MKKLIFITYIFISISVLGTPLITHATDACGGCQSGFSCITSSGISFCQSNTTQSTANSSNPQVLINPNSTSGGGVPAGSCPHATSANGGCDLGYTPLEPIPGLTSGTDLTSAGSLPGIINAIFVVLITIAALVAVLSLTVGGIQYMVSSSAEVKTSGIDRAKASLWGILLIAAAYLILYTVNPRLLDFNLNPCPGGSAGCAITGTTANNTNTASAPLGNQLSADQVTQAGLSGKLQNNNALIFSQQNLPSAAVQNSFNASCSSSGGIAAQGPIINGNSSDICVNSSAYTTNNYTNGAQP